MILACKKCSMLSVDPNQWLKSHLTCVCSAYTLVHGYLRNWYLISGEGDCGEDDCGEDDCGEGERIPNYTHIAYVFNFH